MIYSDFHVHSNFSSDSTASMESMIKKAITLGYNRICFTDHMDYDFPAHYGLPFEFDPNEYYDELNLLTEKYASQIKVLKGVECGVRPHVAKRFEELVRSNDFDFVICSSHLVDVIDPYQEEFWNNRTEEEGIRAYFSAIRDNIQAFNDFDVYGHLDYVVRYAPTKNTNYHYETYADIIDEILVALIQRGKGIEVNTAGFKYGLGVPHPCPEIIKRYFELGGTILTIGSDAHKPEHLAYAFDKTKELLRSLDITSYTVFEKRKPIFIPL